MQMRLSWNCLAWEASSELRLVLFDTHERQVDLLMADKSSPLHREFATFDISKNISVPAIKT